MLRVHWLRFVTDQEAVCAAAGIDPIGMEVEMCPMNSGNVISYPEAPGLAFGVAPRWYRVEGIGKESVWYLRLEKAPHPLDDPALGPPK